MRGSLQTLFPINAKPIIKMYVFLKLATQHCSRNAIQWETLANPYQDYLSFISHYLLITNSIEIISYLFYCLKTKL